MGVLVGVLTSNLAVVAKTEAVTQSTSTPNY